MWRKREREGEKREMFNVCVCGTKTFTQSLVDKLWTIRKRKRMLVEKKKDFFVHIQKRSRKRERERKEKIGRKMRKEREWARCAIENYRQLLPRAVKVINHHRFLAYYTYKRSQMRKIRTRMREDCKACQISTFTFFPLLDNLDSSAINRYILLIRDLIFAYK